MSDISPFFVDVIIDELKKEVKNKIFLILNSLTS